MSSNNEHNDKVFWVDIPCEKTLRENQHEIPGLNRVPFIEGEWEQVILVQQQGA